MNKGHDPSHGPQPYYKDPCNEHGREKEPELYNLIKEILALTQPGVDFDKYDVQFKAAWYKMYRPIIKLGYKKPSYNQQDLQWKGHHPCENAERVTKNHRSKQS